MKIAELRTQDGMTPLTVNQRQRLSATWGLLMIAANLASPVTKEEHQRSIVTYSHAFDVYEPFPDPPSFTAVMRNATSVDLAWTQRPITTQLKLQRAKTPYFDEEAVSLNTHYPCVAPGVTVAFWDSPLYPNTEYFYRMRVWNGVDYSLWYTQSVRTRPLTEIFVRFGKRVSIIPFLGEQKSIISTKRGKIIDLSRFP